MTASDTHSLMHIVKCLRKHNKDISNNKTRRNIDGFLKVLVNNKNHL